jgi:tetratricopeptide (TPR) repeat protein
MPNLNRIFIAKLIIFFAAFLQSFNCQADISKLQKADSLFVTKNYQEAMIIYEDLLQNDEIYSPAMLLKMAFISEGIGDYSNGSFYLAKYYDLNPNPRVITKIKTLTEQSNLIGYELNDRDRFMRFLTDLQMEITSVFAFLLILSLILLFVFRKTADQPRYYLPSLLFLVLTFVANNFLSEPNTGIVTGSPTLVMDKPTAAGKLLKIAYPGHRVVIKSSKDIWFEVTWGNQRAFIKKENITQL